MRWSSGGGGGDDDDEDDEDDAVDRKDGGGNKTLGTYIEQEWSTFTVLPKRRDVEKKNAR
jgi:hypothetical protein